MKNKINIVVVDDHSLLRQGIVSLLQDIEDFNIVHQLSSGEEAINLPPSSNIDVFLMDILMRGMNGIEATRWIKENDPKVKVILISSEISKEYIAAGIKSGIDGYLPKDVGKDELTNAIRQVINGTRYFNKEITDLVLEDLYSQKQEIKKDITRKRSDALTKRENEILALIASGKNLKAIADQLFISVKTVETHKLNIQDKLGLENTAQLVRYAMENNIS
jgi:DNA-binding NarL/FixJ family response regulator